RLRRAADDDVRARPLHRLRPHVVGLRPLAHDLLELPVELVHPLPCSQEREPVGGVLGLVPAAADAELDPSVRDMVCGHDRFGQDRDGPEGDRRDERAEPDPLRQRSEGGERRPRVERAGVAGAPDRHVVVATEEALEPGLLGRARERVPLLPRHALLALDPQAETHQSAVTFAVVCPPSPMFVESVTYAYSLDACNITTYT